MLLENEAVGHTTVSQTSACTKGIVSNYLLNSKVGYLWTHHFPYFGVDGRGFFCSCLNRIPSARRIGVISSRITLPAPAGPSGASEGITSMHGCNKIIPSVTRVYFTHHIIMWLALVRPPSPHLIQKTHPLLFIPVLKTEDHGPD